MTSSWPPPGGAPRPGAVLAIDLGTANTTAALRRDGQDALLRIRGESSMPSAVLWAEQGAVAGAAALRNRVGSPESFVPSPKRLLTMGRPTAVLGGVEVPVVRLLAVVLAAVRQEALRQTDGAPPSQVVLTRPAAWDPDQVEALVQAAALAGFDRRTITTVSEPEAAIRHYAARAGERVPHGGAVAVFDFGAGTCDVAVLQRAGEDWLLLHHGGDPRLGGADLDEKVLGFVRDELAARGAHDLLARLDGDDGLVDRLTLQDQARFAKEELSGAGSSTVWITAGGATAGVTVSRGEYERLIAPETARAADLVARAAAAAPGGLTAVYLTGGSSRGPAVQEAVARSARAPLATLDDPKAVVALGALQVPARQPAPPPPPPPPPPGWPGPPVGPGPRLPARPRTWWPLTLVTAILLALSAVLEQFVFTSTSRLLADVLVALGDVATGTALAASGVSWLLRRRFAAGPVLIAACLPLLVAAPLWVGAGLTSAGAFLGFERATAIGEALGYATATTGTALLLRHPLQHWLEKAGLVLLVLVADVWYVPYTVTLRSPAAVTELVLVVVPLVTAAAFLVVVLVPRLRAPVASGVRRPVSAAAAPPLRYPPAP